jgi:hypothetical protein
MRWIKEGVYTVIPKHILNMLTWEEIEIRTAGGFHLLAARAVNFGERHDGASDHGLPLLAGVYLGPNCHTGILQAFIRAAARANLNNLTLINFPDSFVVNHSFTRHKLNQSASMNHSQSQNLRPRGASAQRIVDEEEEEEEKDEVPNDNAGSESHA